MRTSAGLLMVLVLPFVTAQNLTCDDGWKLGPNKQYCYEMTTRRFKYSAAEDYCTSYGGHLASIHSYQEREFTRVFYDYARSYWIGLNRQHTQEFKWTDKSPVGKTYWQAGEPRKDGGDDKCVQVNSLEWIGSKCDLLLQALCKKSAFIPTEPAQIVPCDDGWILGPNKQYCYALTNTASGLDSADKYCQSNGGRLASIHSDEEREFTKQFHGRPGTDTFRLWVGLSRQLNQMFGWIDESPVDKTYWNDGEPNNYAGIENCVEGLGQGPNGDEPYSWKWNDINCNSKTLHGLCKKPVG